ncbi:MAG: hypothetical protein R2742_13335 [Micropruina glycogenica]
MIDEVMRKHFNAFPQTAPPMAILSAKINTLERPRRGGHDIRDDADMERAAAVLISKVRTIAPPPTRRPSVSRWSTRATT